MSKVEELRIRIIEALLEHDECSTKKLTYESLKKYYGEDKAKTIVYKSEISSYEKKFLRI